MFYDCSDKVIVDNPRFRQNREWWVALSISISVTVWEDNTIDTIVKWDQIVL